MIIAAVGKNATGKDYLLGYISQKYGLPLISMGDIVRDLATLEGLEHNRDNLHYISEKYMAQDKFYFTKATISKIKDSATENILVSGIRPLEDVIYFKQLYGDKFFLIRVKITEDLDRYNRMIQRSSNRDPKTYEEFLFADLEEERIFHTSQSEEMADVTIYNDKDLDSFHKDIDDLYNKYLKKLLG